MDDTSTTAPPAMPAPPPHVVQPALSQRQILGLGVLLVLVAAVLALLYWTPAMTSSPETLTMQEVVARPPPALSVISATFSMPASRNLSIMFMMAL